MGLPLGLTGIMPYRFETELPPRITITCPEEPDWDAAYNEVSKTKFQELADVLLILHTVNGVKTEGFRDWITNPKGGKDVLVAREVGRLAVGKALRAFIADYWNPGDTQLAFDVDPKSWRQEHPGGIYDCPDLCSLILLMYGVLQPAGFASNDVT